MSIKEWIGCTSDEQQCRDSCNYKGHREDCPLAIVKEDTSKVLNDATEKH